MSRLRSVSHEDRLTLVEHLDELRTRIIIAVFAFAVVIAVCFWQNHALLDLANGPLPRKHGHDVVPTTFGVAEPFTTTLTVTAYAAILITLPIWLWQLYAFVLPAFTPVELRTLRPILLMVPFLFIGGVVFAYFIVVPAATRFLLNFNDDQFAIQLRAKEYYSFLGITLASLGVLFQMPVVLVGITRLGIVTPRQLAQNRRYALLVIAVVAMLLPGTDPVTMLISMVPLILLYELSILLTRVVGGRRQAADADAPLDAGLSAE